MNNRYREEEKENQTVEEILEEEKAKEENDLEKLKENLAVNCIPFSVVDMTYENYEEFLSERRKMMAEKIKNYYYSL